MEYRGREIKFLRTVLAQCEIADLCPDGDVSKIATLFRGKRLSSNVKNMASMIHILNKGYEENKAYFEDDYEANPITIEELMVLDEETFMNLFNEAAVAFYGEKPTVEAEQPKSKKNKKAETSD